MLGNFHLKQILLEIINTLNVVKLLNNNYLNSIYSTSTMFITLRSRVQLSVSLQKTPAFVGVLFFRDVLHVYFIFQETQFFLQRGDW
jgi:hypothetical protein